MITSKSPITCILLMAILGSSIPHVNSRQCHADCNNGSGWNSQLMVTSLEDNGTILLSWQYNMIDDQYTVMHRLYGSINYTMSFPMNSTNHTLTGLLGESVYEFKVCLVTDPLNCGNCQQCYVTSTFLPSQIEQSKVSVYKRERGSNQLSALLTWTGLTIEQAGGLLINYTVSLYTISQSVRTLSRNITVDPSKAQVELTDLMANQMYSFTVRAVNRAGSGTESEEVMFNTNGPQPPMELIAIDSEGVVSVIANNQSTVVEAVFSIPFVIDNRNSTVYYIESDKVFGAPLSDPQNIWVLASMSQGADDVMGIAYDWITRVLYFAMSDQNQALKVWSLPLDNPMFESIDTGVVLLNDANVFMTITPFTGQLYWIEASPSVTGLYQLNLLTGSVTQLHQPNSRRRRNVMCPDSSGLDTIGDPLTTALTYDVVTDRLWLATIAGDIWSCDLSGCGCRIEVEGEALLNATNMIDVLSDIGLPTDSVSLDSVSIYWSGPTGVFSVPRNDTTVVSQFSNLNSSSIVTIDPGQQPLPEETCLIPSEQPMAECVNATNSMLQLRWFAPNITDQCRNQLVAFPTISYTVSYQAVSSMDPSTEVVTFDEVITLINLESFTAYMIEIQAVNNYGSGDPQQIFCTTQPTVLPGPVVDVKVFPLPTSLNITWNPPMFSSSEVGGSGFSNLMYAIELREITSNSKRTVHTIDSHVHFTELQPATAYTVTIVPIILGATIEPVIYFTQTLDNVMNGPSVIMATSMGVATKPISDQSLTFINDLDTTEVAYDSQRDKLYWAVEGELQQLSSGSNSSSSLVEVTSPVGMAVDYIGQRLYWIDASTRVVHVELFVQVNHSLLVDNVSLPSTLRTDEEITDLAVDSPSGLLFLAHNGGTRGISVLRLNGVGDKMVCVTDNNQPYRYHAITVDTENKRIFWIKETAGSFKIGVADYFENGSCINHVNKIIVSELSVGSSTDRISMTYIAGILLLTSSTLPNMIFVTASNFSSFPSPDYQLAVGQYSISTGSGDVSIRSIIANQTSQQYLPDNVGLDVLSVRPSVPVNIHLDDSSSTTSINITWDMVEGVSPDIVTYQVTYSLSRTNGSTEDNIVLKTNNNYFVLTDQSPETTVYVSVMAYTSWYSSDMSPVQRLTSDSGLPIQIQQSRVSVYRRERGSNQLSALLTWTGLTTEQAGGLLINYTVSLYTISQSVRTLSRNIAVDPSKAQAELTDDLMANQMYSFTVRAVNRAYGGIESEEVMFNTNGPQPPMELIAVDSEGVAGVIANNQSTVEEAGFNTSFVIHNSTVYYIEAGAVLVMPLRNPQLVSTLATMPQSYSDIVEMTYDWITRVLYLTASMVMVESSDTSGILTIWSLPLDNPVFEMVYKGDFLPADAKIVMTIAPRIGHLYWIEASPSNTSLYQLNLLDGFVTQLYQSNSSRSERNVMCPNSSGLDTIGELTTALTYDVVTDRLWLATLEGDIWSCDLSGCGCLIEVEGEALLNATNMTDVLSDIGLPTDSVSLDSISIYWSGPTGVFSVPRNNTTMVSQFSPIPNVSSIVTIDPGQQQLPEISCLFPVIDPVHQPQAECINITNSTIFLRWFAPNITQQCKGQLVAFPTLLYNVTYRTTNIMQEDGLETTYDLTAEITGLIPDELYRITVFATNRYTDRGRQEPNPVSCTTLLSTPSMVRNLTVTAHSTELLLVTWERPVITGSDDATLTYNIILNGTFVNSTNDVTTNISIPGLKPETPYSIEVFANNSQVNGTADEVVQTTWPLPPLPEILDATNTSLTIRIPLGEIYEPLVNLSLIIKERENPSIVRKNESIEIEGLQPRERTINQLRPNTEYVIQTHAGYRMTNYNANEDLMLYSDITMWTTEAGVPDAPRIELNVSVIMWLPPVDNGRNITSYIVTVSSSDTVLTETIMANGMTSFDLTTLQLSSSSQSNVTLQAVNEVGASNHSNPVTYATSPITSQSSSGIFSDGVMAGIIIASIIAGIFLIVLTMVMCACCCRNKPKKMDFYDFRIDLPYNNELRVLRMSQMRMANNDLYMCDYSEEDLEALKQIPKDNIILQKELGRGAFGEVWEGTVEDILGPGTGTHRVAIKMLQKNAAEIDKRSFLSEALVMSNFSHPNVLPVLGVCLSNPFFLILELMEAGDLLAFLRGARQENGPPLLTVEELVKIALDVANGARYLETQHFVHRDLAARNCLVSSKGPDRVVKIGDFGLARDVYHSDYYRKEGQGLLPVRWMAPESLLDGKFTVDSDIWSYGILLWEITTLGRQPYPARSNQEVFQFVIGGGRCDKPDNCHPKLYWLMKSCWAHRPEDRPRFRSIVDVLSRQHDRLNRHDSECSDTYYDESEEEDGSSLTPVATTSRYRTTAGSGRSFRSSIRSGASFIATGIATLTRSSRLMNSLRNRGSVHQSVANGNNYLTSLENLVESKDQNGFREIGPF